MFERKTVFIAGAGASREVDFPMGAELTDVIAKKLHMGSTNGWQVDFGDRKVIAAIESDVRKKGEIDINPYYAAGRTIAIGMKQAISIDNYLHAHADNEIITWVGKLGIAASILEAEQNSRLATSRDRDALDIGVVAGSWYATFFQMLTEGVQRSAINGIFDNVSFITFNYDRCIEHYLVHAISNYFQIDQQEAQALVQNLRIEHLYGQVGRLPWQVPRGSTAFGKEFRGQDLPEIASQIRTFTERVDDKDMIQRARQLISDAEVIIYLGFSYGDMNMEILSVEEAKDRAVFGTSYGVAAPNKKVIEREVVNSMGPNPDVILSLDLADMTCSDFLRAYWKPIMRGV